MENLEFKDINELLIHYAAARSASCGSEVNQELKELFRFNLTLLPLVEQTKQLSEKYQDLWDDINAV